MEIEDSNKNQEGNPKSSQEKNNLDDSAENKLMIEEKKTNEIVEEGNLTKENTVPNTDNKDESHVNPPVVKASENTQIPNLESQAKDVISKDQAVLDKKENPAQNSSNQISGIQSQDDEQRQRDAADEQRIFTSIRAKGPPKEVNQVYPNVFFYVGKLKSNFGRSESIHALHNRFGNYRILEFDHAYIQWIFPNKYQSNFNMNSSPLNEAEIEYFLKEPLLAKRYIRSYEMMLDFYGMKIKNYRTGELQRNDNYLDRYEDAVCGHNVLRIRRILTSLNNFGFRRYAIQLCEFLNFEINEGKRPLKNRKGDYNCDWSLYGKCDDEGDYKLLQKNCFQNLDQLNRVNVYLLQLDEQYQQQQQQPQQQPLLQQQQQQQDNQEQIPIQSQDKQ